MSHGTPSPRKGSARDLKLTARMVRRSPTDLDKLAAAFVELAKAQAEADAQAEHTKKAGEEVA